MKLNVINPAVNISSPTIAPLITTNKKHLKILLYGNIQGANHRSQTLIKFLLDSRYSISLVCPNFYLKKGVKQSSLLRRILVGFHLIELAIKASFTDVIYLLPLNTNLINVALLVAKIFRKKLIAEIHVSLYDNLLEERQKYQEQHKVKLEMQRDKLALTKPDYLINTSRHEPNYWANNLDIKFTTDKAFIAPLFSSSTVVINRKFMQDGILRICWWGTFLPLHGLDNILEAMKMLKEKRIPFICNLFGIDDSSFNTYLEKINLQKLNSCVFLRKDLTFYDDSLPQYLSKNCDLALGIFGNTCKANNAVPTKLVEALSIGIPTLTMDSPALNEFFAPQTDLWTCAPSPLAIAEKIVEIINGTAYSVDWQQTRNKVLNTFSITQYHAAVSKVLAKVTNNI